MHGRTLPALALAACALACAGGCNPRTFRLPTAGPLPPVRVEGPSQERFDPFADDDLGPETFTRPPDFENNRPEQRRQIGGGVRPAVTPGQGPLDPFPGLGGRYPNVVR